MRRVGKNFGSKNTDDKKNSWVMQRLRDAVVSTGDMLGTHRTFGCASTTFIVFLGPF